MRLTFRRYGLFIEKEVDVLITLGTLEAVCDAFDIPLFQIRDEIKKNSIDFTIELLYQGYITACKENYRKPKYGYEKAVIWYEHMSQQAQKEFAGLISNMFGKLQKTMEKKKVKQS